MQKIPVYGEDRKDKDQDIPEYILSLASSVTYWSHDAHEGASPEGLVACSENEESLKEQLQALGWGTTFFPDNGKWYACPIGYSVESGPGFQYYPMYRQSGADQGPRTWCYYYQPRESLDTPQKSIGFYSWQEAYDYLFAAYTVDLQALPVSWYELYSNQSHLPVLTRVQATSPEHAKQIYLSYCIEMGFLRSWQTVDYRVSVSKVV